MKTYKDISDLLSEICLDDRVPDGIFRLDNNEHVEILREKLTETGLSESDVVEMVNGMLEGKYPERQAYNANGILVTFPNPEYKKRAIQRGTHFEEDPTKGQPNVDFGNNPAPAVPVKEPSSTGQPVQVEPAGTPPQPSTQIPPQTPSQPVPQPVEPVKKVDALQARSPEEKAKDAQEVEKMLATEMTLDEAITAGCTKNKLNIWTHPTEKLHGKEWYCVDSNQKKILFTR